MGCDVQVEAAQGLYPSEVLHQAADVDGQVGARVLSCGRLHGHSFGVSRDSSVWSDGVAGEAASSGAGGCQR